tara:strand:- start:66 stop:650 length:585 start_codon:yes stop_codon:yes gene_type:complete
MGFEITDGTGTGNSVRVSPKKRMLVEAITTDSISSSSQDGGNAFSVGTEGIVGATLADGAESALFYAKNNDDRNLIVDVCVVSQEQAGYYKFYRNPTSGTLIDNGITSGASQSFNFGSSSIATLDSRIANASGQTFTDGTVITYSRNPAGVQPLDFLSAVVIPKGSSFGISFTPDGATASDVSVFFFVHYPEEK